MRLLLHSNKANYIYIYAIESRAQKLNGMTFSVSSELIARSAIRLSSDD
jgi:hypothetical protein